MEYNIRNIEREIKNSFEFSYDMRGIRAFRETYGTSAAAGAIIYAGGDAYKLDDGTWAIPWNLL